MNCKNCNAEIKIESNYCTDCGAKVVRERITIKNLFNSILGSLGWDGKFLITIRHLVTKPHVVLKEYLGGTRKKYANPFSLFAIATAFSLLIFSGFSDEFIKINVNSSEEHTEITEKTSSTDSTYQSLGYKNELEFQTHIAELQMKYYNILSFTLLPIYAFIAFIVFRKPYNYGEHLVINAFLQGMTLLGGVLIFIIGMILKINIFGIGAILISFLYYCYVYKMLYRLSFGRLLLKILLFLGIMVVLLLIPLILGFLAAVMTN